MANQPRRGRRKTPAPFRHHLEDELDSDWRHRLSSGASGDRRRQRYLTLAMRHLDMVLRGQLEDPELEGLELDQLHCTPDGCLLTLWLTLEDGYAPPSEAKLSALAGALRQELALHVPRRRTPQLRVCL